MGEGKSPIGVKDLILVIQFLVILYLLYRDRFVEWRHRMRRKRHGEYGERLVAEFLDDLEDVFAVYHNLEGRHENQRYEVDHLLLTHQGIILVETKNIKGTIVARKEGWFQIKSSGGGRHYEREIRSPVQQIQRTSRIFEQFLASNGHRVRVQPLVVFADKDVKLKVNDSERYPVLPLYQVEEFIKNQTRDIPLTTRQLRKVKDFIDQAYGR